MKKNLLTRVLSVFTATLMTLSLVTVKTKAATDNLDYGAGNGVKWPSQVNAPYVDLVSYYSDPTWSINGPVKLLKLYQDTGVKFYNLGFIQSTGSVSNNKVKWGWGGYSVLSEGNSDEQYAGIKQSIKELRDAGGDVAISFGGAAGTAFWQTTQDVDVLANTYIEIIDGYNLTRIDLDVEGGAQNATQNVANAKAIKKAQDATGVDVVLTLPVLPSGLTYDGLAVLQAYLENGVNLKVVNIMTMCYGASTLNPGENYGTASLRAVESLKDQLKDYYSKYAATTLSDAEAFAKIGTTVSIGFESGSDPIFTVDWSELVVNHAIQNKIAMTSFWSMNRDAQLDKNSGIYGQYQHTNVFKKFGSTEVGPVDPVDPTVNNKPVINGVSDKTITVGTAFDSMSGVTATDKEDGDLTNSIVVTGAVNTSVAGSYELTYSVTDSKGETTTAKATITVKEKTVVSADTYDESKVYVEGDTVIYNGATYKAKWWTCGETPGTSDVWEKIGDAETPVDVVTLSEIAARYRLKSTDAGYEAKYDLNNDGIIDIVDIVLVAKQM